MSQLSSLERLLLEHLESYGIDIKTKTDTLSTQQLKTAKTLLKGMCSKRAADELFIKNYQTINIHRRLGREKLTCRNDVQYGAAVFCMTLLDKLHDVTKLSA